VSSVEPAAVVAAPGVLTCGGVVVFVPTQPQLLLGGDEKEEEDEGLAVVVDPLGVKEAGLLATYVLEDVVVVIDIGDG
jgi:hypothetical protein